MPPKRQQKGRGGKKFMHKEEEDKDESNETTKKNSEPQKEFRKIDIDTIIDSKYGVPYCYIKFFEKKVESVERQESSNKKDKKDKKNFLFKIVVEKKKGKKTSTTLSWDPAKVNFPKKQVEELKDYIQDFGTSCKAESNSINAFGTFNEQIKEYLIDTLHIEEDKIQIILPKPEVPKYFEITITYKEEENITIVKWNPKKWTTQTYNQFVEDFRTTIVDEWDLHFPEEFERKANHVFTINGKNLTNNLFDFFTKTWEIDPKKINVKVKSIKNEPEIPIQINHEIEERPFSTMLHLFNDYDQNSYFKKMSDTIGDTYSYDKEILEKIVIKTKLKFEQNSSNKEGSDKHGEVAWITTFSILKAVSIDGIKSGKFLTEGDTVIVRYAHRKRPFKGLILQINRGKVTAVFKTKYGRVPPGYKKNEQEKEEYEDEEEETKDEQRRRKGKQQKQGDDDDDIQYEDDEEEEDNSKHDDDDDDDDDKDYDYDYFDDDDDEGEDAAAASNKMDEYSDEKYTITFKPNDTIVQRCAFGLMNLYNIKGSSETSTIKKIITGENVTSNKSNEEEINDASFDITDSAFLSDEDKQNPNIMKFLKLNATVSQTRCVEMILQNNVSIVHGPPGCGKTSSIALFVYHLLKKSIGNDKKSIHLCAYSNQAVENIVKFISPIVKALGKKMVWIPRKGMEFETKKDFDEATEEEKNLSIFKILNRNTKEAQSFRKLQEIKWDLNLKMKNFKQAIKNHSYYPEGKPRRFSLNEQKMMDDLRFKIERNLIYESDVVCSTLLSSARLNMIDFKFDYVFIDEASQANQPCSIVPLVHHPSKLVLLGDHKQLDARSPDIIKERHPDTTMSLYCKLIKNGIQHEMLTVQFRMNPLIAEFPNKEFYHGRIKNAPNMEEKTFIELQNIPTPIVFIDVKDGREKKVLGTTYRNIKEAIVVEKIINNFKKNRIDVKDVGVITPYHGQVHLLRHKINKIDYNGLRISSVDTFQGSERDFIVLSLVRTNEQGQFGFLPDKHRINVSLTRARKGIVIVGNFSAILSSNDTGMHPENQFLVDLCKFYKDKNALIDSRDPKIEKIDIFVEKKKTNKLVINMVDVKPIEDQEIEYISDSNSDYDVNSVTADDDEFYIIKK